MNSPVQRADAGSAANFSSLRVMIVDDEPHVRMFMRIIVESLGVTDVVFATNGEEAIVQYQQGRPDLVLMDINMPVMPGDEAIRLILNLDPDAAVIIVSSENAMETVRYFQEAGAIGYVLKAMPKDEIARAIYDVLVQLAPLEE